MQRVHAGRRVIRGEQCLRPILDRVRAIAGAVVVQRPCIRPVGDPGLVAADEQAGLLRVGAQRPLPVLGAGSAAARIQPFGAGEGGEAETGIGLRRDIGGAASDELRTPAARRFMQQPCDRALVRLHIDGGDRLERHRCPDVLLDRAVVISSAERRLRTLQAGDGVVPSLLVGFLAQAECLQNADRWCEQLIGGLDDHCLAVSAIGSRVAALHRPHGIVDRARAGGERQSHA